MKKILVLGAGLSSSSLIDYFLDRSEKYEWRVIVGDKLLEVAKSKVHNHPNGEAFEFDVFNEQQRKERVRDADLVISLLPARFHLLVAKECVDSGVNMVTASYVSAEMKELDAKAKEKGIIILNEVGVDPGIDHMSAMKIIDKIKDEGGKLISFYSNTGGLIAPEYDNNPWNYKFTWNPRNVIVAGQGTAMYLKNGKYKYVPYNQLFTHTEKTSVLDVGDFEFYPNRDSLSYRKVYGIEGIPTIFRGTMRRQGYSAAWNVFVQLGLTDDTYIFENSENTTYRDFINSYLMYHETKPVEQKLAEFMNINTDSDIMKRLVWLGIFEEKKIGLPNATPAQILQHLIVPKWVLGKDDKDMIVMQHKFIYEKNNIYKEITSSMVYVGKDTVNTAMALTVGLPAAIAAKNVLLGKFPYKGVQIPVKKEFYNPILEELKEFNVEFIEEENEIKDIDKNLL